MKKKTLLTVMAILANGLLAMHARTQSPEINQSDVEKELNEKIEFSTLAGSTHGSRETSKKAASSAAKPKRFMRLPPMRRGTTTILITDSAVRPGPRQTCWQRFLA